MNTSVPMKLKAATRRLIEACGGQESAVLIPGMPIARHQSFSEAGSAAQPDRFLRIDVAALMELDCGQPLVTAELARASGHVLVPLPRIAAQRSPLGRITAQALKETSDVFSRLGGFLEDGTLTFAESTQLDKEIDEAIEKLLALKAQADFEAGQGAK
jgi:hypothetical protein